MIRLVAILALVVLLVLAALTAFGRTGGWLAGVLLTAVAVTWQPSSCTQDGMVEHAKEQDDRKQSAAQFGLILLGSATLLLALTLECGPPLLFIASIVIAVLWLLRRSSLRGQITILLLIILVVPIITPSSAARHAARLIVRSSRLKHIALAMHNYHDAYGAFPPAYIADKNGRPMHSWRTLLLPFLDCEALYKHYDLHEPWDGPNNRRLASETPAVFRSFGIGGKRKDGISNYTVVTGPETAWPGPQACNRKEITRPAYTIMVVETFASDIGWIEPRDLSVDAFIDELAPEPTLMEWWLKPPLPDWRRRPYERGVVMFDDNVYFANGDLPPEDAKTLVRADEPRYQLPVSLQGRNRLPVIVAGLPVSESVIRGTGFFTLLGAAIGLLLAVRGRVPLSRESEAPAHNFAETS